MMNESIESARGRLSWLEADYASLRQVLSVSAKGKSAKDRERAHRDAELVDHSRKNLDSTWADYRRTFPWWSRARIAVIWWLGKEGDRG